MHFLLETREVYGQNQGFPANERGHVKVQAFEIHFHLQLDFLQKN
jgi:hypothetical protein